MEEIKKILSAQNISFMQPFTNWGEIEIKAHHLPTNANKFATLVFVECYPSNEIKAKNIKIIDHHGPQSHKPASLLQTCRLLGVKPSLRQKIIASIDSDFLKETIKKFPRRKKLIINIWESGYKKRFKSKHEWLEFTSKCKHLWSRAKSTPPSIKKYAVVWDSPPSATYLSALADLEGWKSLIIKASPETTRPASMLFQGDRNVVRFLASRKIPFSYHGRGYFGCKLPPRQLIDLISAYLVKIKAWKQ